VLAHGEDLRYCYPLARWLGWDGRRWLLDAQALVEQFAKDTVARMYLEATRMDYDGREALVKHALKSESHAAVTAMIASARSEPSIPILPDELDRDPWLLTVLNGTIELRTATLRPHRRTDLMTKLAPVALDPSARCPTWCAFLERIMAGNDGLIRFLQRAVGYTLTGSTRERVVFLLHGAGRNGKSTLLGILDELLGDYAKRAPTETLLAKRETSIPNDVAQLRGARLVSTVETEEGARLAEAKVKSLVGRDRISARFMRGEWFDFLPEFKPWLATNHRPVIRGTDPAIWDRIRLIPFGVRISDGEEDKELPSKLTAELSGILNWALEGCVEWQRQGLGTPPEVAEATAAYRSEMDTLAVFLGDRCLTQPGLTVIAGQLYDAFKSWCEANGEHAISQRALGLRLQERGFESVRLGKARTRGWMGLGLLEADASTGRTQADGTFGITGLSADSRSTSGILRPPASAEPMRPPSVCAGCGEPGHLRSISGVLLHDNCRVKP
jgi:putative DNA primase/helicase